VACLGHGHPEIAGEIARQSSQLMALTPSYANDARAGYLAKLSAALPASLDRAFLCNSGTESVEAALKIARWSTGRPGVVAAMRGFHGRSMGALSATADPKYRKPFAPLVPGFDHVPYGSLETLEATLSDQTAALILEVIQGEGGVRPAPEGYLSAVRELCDARGVLLIFDEVQTGFGRTGTLFGFENSGAVPDILALGKGIAAGFPMGATVFGPSIGPLPPGSHGSTFGGSPLACAVASTTLEILQRDELPARAARLGARALERLGTLIESPNVRDVRGRGLMIGIEVRGRVAPVRRALLERRVLSLAAGVNVLRLLPPLNISDDLWDEALDAVIEVLT
ncbi:MAG: aspartate aminotransferase family protein, partial [Planctomycetota bacterium]